MKRFKAIQTYLLPILILGVSFITGCGGGGEVTGHWLPPQVVSLTVAPATASIPITGFQQFTATAIYIDGSSRDVTASSSWISGTTGVARVSPTSGFATGVASGTSIITATFGGKSGLATLTVNAAISTKFEVKPSSFSLPVTGTQQFTAIETFSDGTSYDRTAASTWTAPGLVGGLAVATMSANGAGGGIATGRVVGTTQIIATYAASPFSPASATLTVNAATATKFEVKPTTFSVPVSGIQQFTAIETFSDGTSYDRTAASTWTAPGLVGGLAVATLSANGAGGGVATGKVVGSTQIIATYAASPFSPASATLTVNAATSTKFEVKPTAFSMPVSGTQQYTAIETFSDGTSYDRTALSSWSAPGLVGGLNVATLSANGAGGGVATGKVVGSTQIIATYAASPFSPASATLTVNAATPTKFEVKPTAFSMPVTGTQQYTAIETFSDGTSYDRTAVSNWTAPGLVGGLNVATLSANGAGGGVATGNVAGSTQIIATYAASPFSPASATLNVTAAASTSLRLTPLTASIPVGGIQQYTLLEIFSDGTSQPRTTDLATAWSTTNNAGNITLTASGANAGLATGFITTPVGTPVTIRADYGGKFATAQLTVTAATSTSLRLTPLTASIPVGGTQQYALDEIFSDGTSQTRTADLATAWSSTNNTGNASLTPPGLTAGLATGLLITPAGTPVTIRADYGGKFATADLTVTAALGPPVTPLAINLGNAASYGIASRAGLTSTGVTVVNGDVALYPLGLCSDATGTPADCLVESKPASALGLTVNGKIRFPTDSDAGATALAVTNDLVAAWVEGFGKLNTRGTIAADQMAGKTFLPGVYTNANLGLAAGGIATMDAGGDMNAIFIFQVGGVAPAGDFTDSGTLLLPSEIKLRNGAQARNVWFVVGRDITIGSGTTWNGTILAGRDATVKDGSSVMGRVLGGASGAGAIVLTGAAAPSVTSITVPQ